MKYLPPLCQIEKGKKKCVQFCFQRRATINSRLNTVTLSRSTTILFTLVFLKMQNSLGIVKQPKLGDDVEVRCGRCKDTREHVVAALTPTGAIERVQCRTCGSNHKYREAKPAKTASTRTRSATGATSRKTLAELEQNAGPARDYSMQTRFKVGDRINHPKFGTGLVVEERSGKIDVKFGREVKTLIHSA
jgi:hypothetical protein